MTDLGKLLDDYERAVSNLTYDVASPFRVLGIEYKEEEVKEARSAIESHAAELRERAERAEQTVDLLTASAGRVASAYAEARQRAERAEAEARVLREECAQISDEFGLPPTIRPAEGEIRRMVERARRTEQAEAKLARVLALLVGYPGDAYGIPPSAIRKALGEL